MQRILVIDDDAQVRKIVTSVFHNYGFLTCEAESGEAGLQVILTSNPDLVICDVNMPGMDGYTTLTTLRRSPEFTELPFIFLTANTTEAGRRRAFALGADDYLAKPFSLPDLLLSVDVCLKTHQAASARAESSPAS